MPYGYGFEKYGWVLAPWEKEEIRRHPDRGARIVNTALEQYGAGCLIKTETAQAGNLDRF